MNVEVDKILKSKEVTRIETVEETVVYFTMTDREAKMLMCLIGAMSPLDAEEIIVNRSMDFEQMFPEGLKDREVVQLTGDIYDGIFDALL